MLKKYWQIFIAAALALFAAYWLTAGDSSEPRVGERDDDSKNIVMTGGEISESKDGEKAWDLTAETIEIDEKTNRNVLTGVKGKLYRKAGGTIDITAGRGIYTPDTAEILLFDGVVAVYSEGWTLKCREISWASEENLIVAKGGAEFTKDDLFVQGDEIQTDRELIAIKVTGGSVRKGKTPSDQS
jgi:LPS export ABC transporter protein LptC